MNKRPKTRTYEDKKRLLALGRYVDPSPADAFIHALENDKIPGYQFIGSLRMLIGRRVKGLNGQ